MQNRCIKKAKPPSEEGASARSYQKNSEPNCQLRRGAQGAERQQQQPGRAPAAPVARLAAVDIEQGYDADVGEADFEAEVVGQAAPRPQTVLFPQRRRRVTQTQRVRNAEKARAKGQQQPEIRFRAVCRAATATERHEALHSSAEAEWRAGLETASQCCQVCVIAQSPWVCWLVTA